MSTKEFLLIAGGAILIGLAMIAGVKIKRWRAARWQLKNRVRFGINR